MNEKITPLIVDSDLYMELVGCDTAQYVVALQQEVRHLRERLKTRAGATASPIEVNADNFHSTEAKLAATTMINRTNRTLGFLEKEVEHGG